MQNSSCCSHLTGFWLGLLSAPDDGFSTFLWNVGKLISYYMTLDYRRLYASKSPFREIQQKANYCTDTSCNYCGSHHLTWLYKLCPQSGGKQGAALCTMVEGQHVIHATSLPAVSFAYYMPRNLSSWAPLQWYWNWHNKQHRWSIGTILKRYGIEILLKQGKTNVVLT